MDDINILDIISISKETAEATISKIDQKISCIKNQNSCLCDESKNSLLKINQLLTTFLAQMEQVTAIEEIRALSGEIKALNNQLPQFLKEQDNPDTALLLKQYHTTQARLDQTLFKINDLVEKINTLTSTTVSEINRLDFYLEEQEITWETNVKDLFNIKDSIILLTEFTLYMTNVLNELNKNLEK